MKIESIHIQNFKRFNHLEISFKNGILDEVSDRYLILGDNGTGKTTLLQAIALPLALATGRIQDISDFDWIGFLPGRYWRWGDPRIEMQVLFEPEELNATRELAQKWYEAQSPEFKEIHKFVEPGDSQRVHLILSGDFWKVGNTPAEQLQFRGRYYAQWFIKKNDQSVRHYFLKLPGIFWFDQFRNLGSNSNPDSSADHLKERSSETSFEVGVGRLRRYLIDWRRKQDSGMGDYANSYLLRLERLYRTVFPDRSFSGLEQRPSLDSPTEEETYFLLNDGYRTYDIAEMSAGEQSIFPLLYEFVRQQIAYSIVLIDEVDLNLHPPAAQYFVAQLMKIEPTCQFIITTHSDSVSNVIGESETYRLKGGKLCL
ncbi:MAG: AAA family ATPase [Coleofasciculus sp. B1-GNL1-01]|uniref:AAA family ATPase n=1 Tax=Coleofasciculus sp. B1-GNL1-01 TaxID=3068484 RepID=UPI0032F761D3